MAYEPYSAVNSIYKLKGQWDDAYKSGDTNAQNSIAQKAQQYYTQLRDNGYGDIADELTASNYAQAKAINDKWAKMGGTSTRDYFYSLGKSKGMSQDDVDALIGWDNQTGEVSFGGKKIGTPDAVVDGVSYWKDTAVLDNAFSDYINRSGTTVSDSVLQSQHNNTISDKINSLWGTQKNDHNELTDMYKKEYESIKNTNPFTTDEAKAILGKYDLAGLQGRDNAVASGSASNGGNIDSYAAANAMRQQAALVNQGQMVVLDAHQQKLDNARAILEGLGAYQSDSYMGMQNTIGLQQTEAQRLFENDQTAKNNDVARKSEIASVTGYAPTEWTYDSNIYLNSDGTVKDEFLTDEFDSTGGFTTIINNAKAKLATTTDATEKAQLQATINAATQAKALKTFSSPKYAQYASEVESVPVRQTEQGRQSDKALEATVAMNEANNQNTLDQLVLTAQLGLGGSSSGSSGSTGTVKRISSGSSSSSSSGSNSNKTSSSSSGSSADESADFDPATFVGPTRNYIPETVDELNQSISDKYGEEFAPISMTKDGQYIVSPSGREYVATEVLGSDKLTQDQKNYLLLNVLNIPLSVINTVATDSHYSRR